MSKQVFGRQPVAIVAAIQAGLVFAVSMGWLSWAGLNSAADATYVAAVLNGLAAVYLALGTTETLLAPVIEAFKALFALLVFYGLSFGVDQQALAIAAITAVFALIHQGKTSPQESLALDSADSWVIPPPS